MNRKEIVKQINFERVRQDKKWGFPQRNSLPEWGIILGEEFGEVAKEMNEIRFRNHDDANLKAELIQLAAVCYAILEHEDVIDELRATLLPEPQPEPPFETVAELSEALRNMEKEALFAKGGIVYPEPVTLNSVAQEMSNELREMTMKAYAAMGAEFNSDGTLTIKKPLPPRPRSVWLQERYDEIMEAISRYRLAGMSIPPEWLREAVGLGIENETMHIQH